MMAVSGKPAVDHGGLGRIVETGFDPVESQDPAHLSHEKGAVPKCHPIGHVQPLGNRDDFVGPVVAVLIQNRVDLSPFSSADKQGALGTQGHGTGVGHVAREEVDGKSRRQLDLIDG